MLYPYLYRPPVAFGCAVLLLALAALGCSPQKEPETETANSAPTPPIEFAAGDRIVFDEIIPTADGGAYGLITDTYSWGRDNETKPGVWYLKGDKAYPVTVVDEPAPVPDLGKQSSHFTLWRMERKARLAAESERDSLQEDAESNANSED